METKEIKTSNYSTLQNYIPTFYECKLFPTLEYHVLIIHKVQSIKKANDHGILSRFFISDEEPGPEWFSTLKVILLLNEGQEPPNPQANCFVHYMGRIIYHISWGTLKGNYVCQCLKRSHGPWSFSPRPKFY